MSAVRNELSLRAQQFRVVQKRLLVRFKDKTPNPLGNMDLLLEVTFRQLVDLADTYANTEKALQVAANNLSCATQLMNIILRYNKPLRLHNILISFQV